MLAQIVFVYRDEFAAKLVEKLLQDQSIGCYSITKVEENFAYIIDDLQPQLVMVDEQVYAKHPQLIDESLKQAKAEFISVLLGLENDPGKFDKKLALPIDIDTFVDQARSLAE